MKFTNSLRLLFTWAFASCQGCLTFGQQRRSFMATGHAVLFLHIGVSRPIWLFYTSSIMDDKLRKLHFLYDHVRERCANLYQPRQKFSVDEHMIRQKGRTPLKQHLPKNPTKWGQGVYCVRCWDFVLLGFHDLHRERRRSRWNVHDTSRRV